jgi:cellulose biosynthesis protein BcsQ
MLSQQVGLSENIYATPYENLWLVPADFGNRHLDVLLEEVKQSKKRLKLLIHDLEKKYDYVILDCPPGIGLLSEAVFVASDIVLMPAIPTTLSMRTYDMIVDFFTAHELKVSKLMCFFSMVDVRKNLHSEVINKCKDRPGFLNNYIPYLSLVEKMGISIAPVGVFAPNSYAAECFRGIWHELNKTG